MAKADIANLELSIAPLGHGLGLTLRLMEPDIRHGPFPVALDQGVLRAKSGDMEAYGAALRDMLFADPQAREAFLACRAAGLGAGKQLRVRLLLPPNLHHLRWEALLDPHSGRGLARDGDLLLSRYLSGDDYTPLRLRPKGALRALVAVASPTDAARYGLALIDAAAETARIITALDELRPAVITATWAQLSAALREGYDILYLVAHGMLKDDQPQIYLVDAQGNADVQRVVTLSDLLRSLGERRPRLVVLASCESAGDGYSTTLAALGPQLAQAGVPAVLAMQGNLSITTNERFAPVLFRELLVDGAIDRAVNMARLAVADDRPDWWMPVLYTRLRDGLIWAEPQGTEAPTTIGTAPPMPALMIGRDSDLATLKQRVGIEESGQQGGSIKVLTAMRGWPGVGKTTLAAALAHDKEIATHFPDGVLWASLGQKPNLFAELGSWGRALGIPDLYGAKTVEEASQLLAGLLRTKRSLLIVDDVWEAEHLLPFRIGGVGCAMLLTTRLPEIARAIAPTPDDVYVLGVLDPVDALSLVRTLAPTVVATNEAACRELVADLEGLPLALQVAGRLLHTEAGYGFEVIDLVQKLREGAALIAAQAPADRADIANQTTPTVAALLDLSTSRLDETSLVYFAYLGAFAPKPATFDMAAIKSVWKVDDPKPTLRMLIDRGLLEPTDSRYWMHAILVAHARSFWKEEGEQ